MTVFDKGGLPDNIDYSDIIKIVRILAIILSLLFFTLKAHPAFATTVTITNIPASINEQPFSLNVSISGASSATNYLRVNLYPPGTTRYFGYTYNGTSYINSSDFSQYFPINIDSSGNWSGSIQAKIDTASNYYTGPGVYSLKVRRYTQSGASYTWSNEASVTIESSSQTPVTTPIPSPSLSPTPTPASTPSPTPKPTSSFTISNIPSQIDSDQSFNVSVNLTSPTNKNTDYYLSGAFKKVGGTKYFGLTKNNSSWVQYNSSNYLNHYKITTDDSGNWTDTLEVKPDIEDSDYKGSGDYIFKVARYLSGSSPTWSNEAAITINDVANDYTSDSSTPQPTLSTISSTSPKPTPAQSLTPKPTQSLKFPYKIASVAAATTSASPITEKNKIKLKNQKQANPLVWVGLTFIFAGICLVGYIYLTKNAKIHFSLRKRN